LDKCRRLIQQKALHAAPQEEIDLAMRDLARLAYYDKAFWFENGWTQQDWSKFTEQDFVDFVTRKTTDTAFKVPRSLMALHRDKGNTRSLHLLEILQTHLAETFDSVYKTHPDLQRGIQKASGCQIVPKEDGIEKLNYFFGDEDEMILHHYLYYTVNPPDKEFFLKKFRELSANPDSKWVKWAEDLGSSSESPYDKICEPGAVMHRLMFCQYLLEDSGYIQIFREQIFYNSQAIFMGADKCVASGTGQPFVLNLLKPGESAVNQADVVSGKTFLRLDFNAKVTVFTDLKQALRRLPQDPLCKGFINQAYAVNKNDARTQVEDLRQHVQTQRPYCYVDTKTREKFRWGPSHQEPKPLLSDELRENDFLCLGPSDSRGINFRIPRGEGHYLPALLGATTTLDEAEQALWRLRELGNGQEPRVWIDQAMADRILAWLRPIEGAHLTVDNITLGHVMFDIIKRTIWEDVHGHGKAASFRITNRLAEAIEHAMNQAILEGTDQDVVHRVISQTYRRLFIDRRIKLPGSNFKDIDMLSPLAYLDKLYADALKAADDYFEKALENIAKLQKGDERELPNLMLGLRMGCVKGDTKYAPRELILVYEATKQVSKTLSDERKALAGLKDYYEKYLPKRNAAVDMSAKGRETQMLVQTKINTHMHTKYLRGGDPDAHTRVIDLDKFEDYDNVAAMSDAGANPLYICTPDHSYQWRPPRSAWSRLGNNIRIGQSASFLLGASNITTLPIVSFVASCKKGEWRFCIVTSVDRVGNISEALSRRRLAGKEECRTGLYPLFEGHSDNLLAMEAGIAPPDTKDPNFVLGFSLMRFILGSVDLNAHEKAVLGESLRSLRNEEIDDLRQDFSDRGLTNSGKLLTELVGP
jgi:hypothetical protein